MSSRLRMTLAIGNSDRTRPLSNGTVKPDGLDLICLTLDPHEAFWRMIRYEEFDASEMSMSSYLMAKEAGKGLIAIPVFPSRAFRHSYIFCNVDSKINEPGDLVEKKVGVPEYQITAALWVRGMLQHEYGISPDKMKWFTEREERLPFTAPKQVCIKRIPKGKDLDSMLVKREIDAIIMPTIPSSVTQKSPKVKRLFQDYKKVEQDYYRKTGYYPIMHTVVIREKMWRENPWVAVSLLEAFQKAKYITYEENQNPYRFTFEWMNSVIEEQKQIFGDDPYPYSLKENRKALEVIIEYSHEQGLTRKKIPIEKLFAENTLDY